MQSICKQPRSRPAFSLIEILVVMVLLIALSAGMATFYLGKSKGKDGAKAHTPIERAHDSECMINIRSVRQAIAATKAMDTDEKPPASLDEIRDIQSIRKCAVGGEPYVYDPQTGEVHCPHPGHENY